MGRTLHSLSSFLFYLLTGSFFIAYLLDRNSLLLPWSDWWMKIADLPLALVALLYGGSSLYFSVKRKEGVSWGVLLFIAIPLTALFIFLVILNFWNVLGLPKGAAV
ncbi:MAG: hypothetical protein WCG83_07280 [Candidatus Peregrinibacteria bacterium]